MAGSPHTVFDVGNRHTDLPVDRSIAFTVPYFPVSLGVSARRKPRNDSTSPVFTGTDVPRYANRPDTAGVQQPALVNSLWKTHCGSPVARDIECNFGPHG